MMRGMKVEESTITFTNGELKLLFQRIEEKIDGLRDDVRNNNERFDLDIKDLRKDVDSLKIFQARALVVWGFVVFVAGLVVNRML